MKVSGHPHALDVCCRGKSHLSGLFTDTAWTFWRREKYLCLLRVLTPDRVLVNIGYGVSNSNFVTHICITSMKNSRRMMVQNICLCGLHLVLSFTYTTNDIIRIPWLLWSWPNFVAPSKSHSKVSPIHHIYSSKFSALWQSGVLPINTRRLGWNFWWWVVSLPPSLAFPPLLTADGRKWHICLLGLHPTPPLPPRK